MPNSKVFVLQERIYRLCGLIKAAFKGDYMWFKKRKSRKQLIAEIEELQGMLERYVARYHEKDNALYYVTKNIQTINASCITHGDDPAIAKESLCDLLAKAISPYIKIESYQMVGEPWYGEWKHCASIQILEQKE